MCLPYNSTTGVLNFDAPCNQVQAISAECLQGKVGFDELMDPDSVNDDNDDSLWLDIATQRDCYYQSEYFITNEGCAKCYIAHGGENVDNYGDNEAFATRSMSIFSTSYCAVTITPTLGFEDALNDFEANAVAYFSTSQLHSTFSGPLGSAKAVSLYYTPSVTGSAAWVVAEATETWAEVRTTGTASNSAGTIYGANATTWH